MNEIMELFAHAAELKQNCWCDQCRSGCQCTVCDDRDAILRTADKKMKEYIRSVIDERVGK
jgi:hypothetical protein